MNPSDPQPPAASTEFLPGGWTLVEKIADTEAGALLRVRRGTETARARILASARIEPEEFTRRLNHVQASFRGIADPAIVRLTGGGIAHGTPFLTYAETEASVKPVREYIGRRNGEDRVMLFFTICRAVRHAHANLLTHGGLANPAVISVREADATPMIDGFAAGYLAGDDPAASTGPDIAALGSAILPAVFEGRTIPGELRDIASKAEQGGYESVEQLALDVERYSKGLPVLARPQTPAYRIRKFLWRHKTVVLASAGTLVAVLLFFWFAAVSIRERYRLEAALNDLRGTAGLMAVQMPQHIANLPQSIELRRKMIAQGVAYMDEHLPELNPEDRVQRRVFALGQYETANAMAALGDFDQALTRYRSARDLFWQDGASLLPDPQVATAMGETLLRRANLLLLTRQPAEAAAAAEQCVSLAPGIRGNDSANRIALTCRALRVRAILDQGRGGISAGELASLEQSEANLAGDRNATEPRMDARYALADAYYRQNNHAAALEQARQGLDLVAGINKGLGASIQKARLMFVAGQAETAMGGEDAARAANRFSECIDILREIMRRQPRDLETRELLSRALIESAAFGNPEEPLLVRGPLLEADTLAKGLLNDSTQPYAAAHMLRVRALGKLGDLLSDCNLRKQALDEFAKAGVKLPGEDGVAASIRNAAKACP